MRIDLFHVDAFTNQLFSGNPAAVCILESWLPDAVMRKMAAEHNLAETAFVVPRGDKYDLKWYTPEIEMDLCGHATLASAHVLFEEIGIEKESIAFETNSGLLQVKKVDEGYSMDFPSRIPVPAALPDEILQSIGVQPRIVMKHRDYVLIYDNEEMIRSLHPDASKMNRINLDPGGVIVTAPGNEVDFVSRFFTPQASIFEDPVTGSAHCSLIPYWSGVLKKKKMIARQLSQRGGTLFCEDLDERVRIGGEAVTYSRSQVFLSE